MTLNEIKQKLEEVLKDAADRLNAQGVIAVPGVETTENDVDGDTETVFIFGSLSVKTENMSEDDILYLPIDVELDSNGCASDGALADSIEAFKTRISLIEERLSRTDDKSGEIKKICEEIDAELEAKYQAELDKMNASVKNNLKVAIMATAVLVVIALASLLARALF